jgi:hypothetical protein
LPHDAPFLFVRKQLRNPGSEPLELRAAEVAGYALDLGKPPTDLRVQGTGGLAAPQDSPGSYVFLTVADPATRGGVVSGWLTHDRASGVLFPKVKDGRVRLTARADYGRLRIPAGGTAALETLVIGHFDDARLGQEEFAAAMAKQYRVKLPPQPTGYCTWYSDKHGGAGNEKAIVELAGFAARELQPFGFSFVQIDDKWQDGADFNGPARRFDRVKPGGPYAGGMGPVAERIKELGLTAGIWFMPFAANHQDPAFAERMDWFVKRQDGKPYETKWGGTSFDLTHPEVREHIRGMATTIRGWGYDYFKMDGLWTGSATRQIYINDGYKEDEIGDNAPFHDPDVTNIEAMRSGLKLVREAAGPDTFFSGCNLSQNMRSFSGAVGLVDSMRIGPDNGRKWADYQQEIAKNGGGSIITGPVRGSRLYFLHGRIWWNDPDPYYVSAKVPLEHARLITTWVGLSGQIHLNSDWLPDLPAERLELLRRTMPAHGATARPIDYFDSAMPSMWLVSDTRGAVRRDVLGLFNWDAETRNIGCPAARAGLDPDQTYHAFDFWHNQLVPSFKGDFAFEVPAASCRVIAVRAAAGHPLLLGTSRHVSQGMVDVRDETWDAAAATLGAASQVVAKDRYELRIAGINDGGRRWQAAAIEVTPEDAAAGVKAKLGVSREGLLRATIESPVSREVRWSVRFTSEAAEERVRLTPRPGPAPRINGPKIHGARPGNPFLFRIPCTGTRPIRFEVEGLPAGLALDAATGIITGTTPAQGEYEMVFHARNAAGEARRPFRLVAGETLALTPPMGYNHWYAHFNRITQPMMAQAATAMVASGMADAGYQYVNIDDCWMNAPGVHKYMPDQTRVGPLRDQDGNIQPNAHFPDMKGLVDHIHSLGLKAGIYTSPGPATCTGCGGSHGHEAQDARRFAEWGFDFLKYDWCSYARIAGKDPDLEKMIRPFELMGREIAAQKRDIVFNLCQYGMGDVWQWGREVGGHAWRTAGDFGFELDRFFDIALNNAKIGEWNGPGGWNDPDYLQIGMIGAQKGALFVPPHPCPLSPNEQYSLMSLWCLLPAPLIYSGDMTQLDDFTLGILCNPEMIDVNQDPLGKPARVVMIDATRFLMAKELEGGALAVGLFNRGDKAAEVSARWKDLGIEGARQVTDLWRQQRLAIVEGRVAATIPRHGVLMIRLDPPAANDQPAPGR